MHEIKLIGRERQAFEDIRHNELIVARLGRSICLRRWIEYVKANYVRIRERLGHFLSPATCSTSNIQNIFQPLDRSTIISRHGLAQQVVLEVQSIYLFHIPR